ncbi:hypothetical protein SFRURICE_006577 [Spodoptera frugiperda]|uniref:SFRICE_035890 n=1 Tax=Spodoptera frugiperda TaxID=7108 RepID=A0A2H1WCF9_SPOFR|nr:hypothetical protein SFRURICE_005802 [Spodoptera frugiperda]KAF9822494.1 hypothetical protein SFRURICE_006577 [Spodoptera frugiperda]
MKFTCELTRIENPNEQQLGRKPARHDQLAWSEDPPFLRELYSLFPKPIHPILLVGTRQIEGSDELRPDSPLQYGEGAVLAPSAAGDELQQGGARRGGVGGVGRVGAVARVLAH